MTTRIQLTLFVPPPRALEIESAREVLDPVQFGLIPAHVTLCREDELAGLDLSALATRLQGAGPITLRFGLAEVFGGHGVLLPCVAGEDAFRHLRVQALGTDAIRTQEPHITLAHPRNPRAPGNTLSNTLALPDELAITFAEATLIEQHGNGPWRVRRCLPIGKSPATPAPLRS